MNENFPSSRTPRLRRLSAEEIELWLNVTRGVARRPGSGSPRLPRPRNDAELQASEAGDNPPKGTPSPVERKAPPPLAPLERRLRQELARGHAAPDASLDEAIQERDGDVVLVPRGYHPVAAGPGYDLYYLNVMAGPRRRWLVTTDPDHRWQLD